MPTGNEGGISATVCPLKYDKKWAYAIELDDGTVPTGTFAPDFFSKFQFFLHPSELMYKISKPILLELFLDFQKKLQFFVLIDW